MTPDVRRLGPVELARRAHSFALGQQTVLQTIMVCVILVLVWAALRRLASREIGWSRRLVRDLGPSVTALRSRVQSAPMTTLYVASWSVTSVIQQGTPSAILDLVTRYNSTNLTLLAHNPVRVLFSSAFLVADRALGYAGYVLAYVLVVAALEQWLGWRRLLVVWLAAHVLGSLATAVTESIMIHAGLLAKSYAFAADVGVSYVLIGSCAAFALTWRARSRWLVASVTLFALALPLVTGWSVWDLGHCYAAIAGGIVGWLVARGRPRGSQVGWRGLAVREPATGQ